MTDLHDNPFIISRRCFLGTAGAALATFALPATTRAQDAGVLRYALSAYPPGFDPFRHEGGAAISAKLQIFRGLVGVEEGGEIVSELAEKWEIDGSKYTFHIRKNAVFHNGEPVTAADVVWSLQQITKAGSTAYFVEDLKVISKIEATDEKTVVITLTAPTPAFLKLLATPYAPILSSKVGIEKPVGAGPYKIVSREEGVSIDFEAFDKYYKDGYPKTKKLKMIVYKDESLRVAALESGDVDIIEYVPWQSMPQIESNSDLVLQEQNGPSMYLVFNVEQPPFNDARVRQAVAYAIKREDIVNTAFYGRGAPLNGLPLDETSEFMTDRTRNLWSYDPEKAKALIQQAGMTGKTVKLLSTSTYSMHQDTGLVIQQYLNAVGLKVELELPEWGARVAQGNKGQYQFAINGGALVVDDPDGLTGLIATGSPSYRRSFGYSNKKVDELLAKGRHEIDLTKRKADYEAVADLFKEEVPICPLTLRSQGFALRKAVKDFQSLPGSYNVYSAFELEDVVLA
ncbi:hypothetical protein G6L34_21525 [Agrobacterium tumefaciens]|uniref:ABC transporter substrate-binding protein n=1 Tax=Agrobacterium tumefaciens TaxID=358 RepID=UPI001574CA35|nr:ABC transporter substrate-binding protein [Agrobacterium tumefaciens]NTA50698.1 hypothetical protein [Agrobacterium tumefaciens]